MLLEVPVVVFFNFFLRSLFLLCKNTDDYVHYWNIFQRRSLQSLTKHEITNSAIEGVRGYPVLHHYLVSLFPKKYWVYAGKLFNITYDLFTILNIYFLTNLYFGNKRISDLTYGFFAALIMGTSPILFPVTARLQAMGGRTLGLFFASLFCVFLGYYYAIAPNFFLIVPLVIIGTLILMSSQFALQFIVFYCLFLAILFVDIFPISILTTIAIIILLFPKSGLRQIIDFKIAHMKWYLNNKKGTFAENRNRLADILNLVNFFKNDFEQFVKTIFYFNSYLSAIINIPFFFILFFFAVFGDFHKESTDYFILNSFIAFTLMLLITSHKPLVIMGQSERYLEYATPFVGFYSIYLVDKNVFSIQWIFLFIFINITFVIVNLLVINRNTIALNLKIIPDSLYYDLIAHLKKINYDGLLTVPVKFSFRISIDIPERKYYYRSVNQKGNGFEYFAQDMREVEVPKDNLLSFHEKYGIDTFVFQGKYWIHWFPDSRKYLNLIYENENYCVYQLKEEL